VSERESELKTDESSERELLPGVMASEQVSELMELAHVLLPAVAVLGRKSGPKTVRASLQVVMASERMSGLTTGTKSGDALLVVVMAWGQMSGQMLGQASEHVLLLGAEVSEWTSELKLELKLGHALLLEVVTSERKLGWESDHALLQVAMVSEQMSEKKMVRKSAWMSDTKLGQA
jgi:hypothetical protein